MKNLEKGLNFLIGLILLGNLYYLAPLVGLSKDIVVILVLSVSLFFSFIRFSIRFSNFLFVKIAIVFLLLSIMFFILNSLFSVYAPSFNNLIRVIWYVSFFGWTYKLYRNEKELSDVFLKWTTVILIIISLISYFEYYNYNLFWEIIMNDPRELITNVRLAGTYIDANSFAAALVTYLFIFLRTNKSNIFNWIYFFAVAFLINLSGSRMGLLLIAIVFINHILFQPYFNKVKVIKILIMAFLMLLISVLMFSTKDIDFKANKQYTSETTISRVFDDSRNNRTEASTNERLESLKTGLNTAIGINLIIPPGAIYFESKWNDEVDSKHYPHNSIIYMFVEYGLFFLWPMYILFLVWKKSRVVKLKALFTLLLFQLLFLPNAMYYSTFFLIIFYIDFYYENSCNTSITKR